MAMEWATKTYTGIGSRDTPPEIQTEMTALAKTLAEKGYTLRSGKADGADKAFQTGAESAKSKNLEIYIPWKGFENKSSVSNRFDIVPNLMNELCYDIASMFHPAWGRCSAGAKKLHGRNVCQVLGDKLDSKTNFVIYWALEKNNIVRGGTATAVSIARHYRIPTINMYFDNWRDILAETLAAIEQPEKVLTDIAPFAIILMS